MKLSGEFRKRVLAREWLGGTFLNLGSAVAAEIAGQSGFDWLLHDQEHGLGGGERVREELQAVSGTAAVPIVRIAANEAPRFKQVLDLGAHGVMVPYVGTADEAEAAVKATRYPPWGIRGIARMNRGAGFGLAFEEYYAHAHEWLVLAAQIETKEAIDRLEGIAAVDGVDVLFVGPTDLSYNLGLRGQLDQPLFTSALQRVAAAASAAGKAAGILAHNAAQSARYRELGFTFVALGSDAGSLLAALRLNAAALKGK